MTRIADMYVQLSQHGLADVVSGLHRIQAEGRSTASALDSVGRGGGGGGFLALAANATLAGAGVLKIADFAMRAGGEVLELAGNAEAARVAFGTLLGDAEKGRQLADELTAFADATPFSVDQMNAAGKSLLAFGVAGDDVVPTLGALGDLAAGINAPIGELAEIFGKAKTQGTLFMEDINQLTGRGIPIIQELAKQFGVAESEVKNLVSSGAVSFDNLQEALVSLTGEGGKFHGMMAQQSETLLGKWSTFKDAVAGVGRTIGEALLPLVKSALSFLTDLAKGLANFLQNFGTHMELAWEEFKLFASNGWEQVKNMFANIGEALEWFGDNWATVFTDAWRFVKTVFENIGKNIKAVWQSIMDFIGGRGFTEIDWTPLAEGFKSNIEKLPEFSKAATEETNDRIEELRQALRKNGENIESARRELTVTRNRGPAGRPGAGGERGSGPGGENLDAMYERAKRGGREPDAVRGEPHRAENFQIVGIDALYNLIQTGDRQKAADEKAAKQREIMAERLASIDRKLGQPRPAVVAGGTT